MEIDRAMLCNIIAFIRGKLEPGEYETIGVRRDKDRLRYKVKRWAVEMHNKLNVKER